MPAETAVWMPMYWADYLADTTHLTTFQHGAYLLLIAAYWRKGGPIPNDPHYLAAVTRCTQDKVARWLPPVVAMFTCKDGLLVHKRLEKEILRSSGRLASARASGIASGVARAQLTTITATTTLVKEETTKEEKVVSKDRSNGNGGNGKFSDEDQRLAYAQTACLPYLPGRDDGERWLVIFAAEDVADPGHGPAVHQMLAAAKKAKVGWVSPERRRDH